MTVDEQRDLQMALHAAVSLQTSIRHADSKAQVLLGLQGGMAVVVLQQMATISDVRIPAFLAVAGLFTAAWLVSLAVSGWHLLKTIVPRLTRPRAPNRFAFSAVQPATADLQEQRAEAWEVVSALAGIALSKHACVRRSMPALMIGSASAGALVATAVTVTMAM